MQHFDQAEIREIAIEARGRTLAGLLNRMHRKFDRDAARFANAFAHALGEHEMMTIAGRQIAAGLRDADDRLAGLQLLERQAEVHIALEIERRHVGVGGIVEPGARTQAPCGHRVSHYGMRPKKRLVVRSISILRQNVTSRS